jgi:hypothetical protein
MWAAVRLRAPLRIRYAMERLTPRMRPRSSAVRSFSERRNFSVSMPATGSGSGRVSRS